MDVYRRPIRAAWRLYERRRTAQQVPDRKSFLRLRDTSVHACSPPSSPPGRRIPCSNFVRAVLAQRCWPACDGVQARSIDVLTLLSTDPKEMAVCNAHIACCSAVPAYHDTGNCSSDQMLQSYSYTG
eukprot:365688-Chlamydomonas_euryale.AAC.21